METNSTTDSLNKYSSKLRILGLVLVIVSFAIFIYNTREQENTIQVKNAAITEKDSIIEKVKIQIDRKDSLKTIIENYLQYRKAHDVESLDGLYSDTLAMYFKYLRNCSKEQVKKSDADYWKKYSRDSFYLKSEPEFIIAGDSAKAIVQGLQCKTADNCVDQIMEFKFNTHNKINSVRAYYAK